ncbi:hypothetical protein KQI74_16275 [Paenibacillus barcinonensis]|uniref:hypothetical protein n=1 Tax=Paenibacillus TaxID=44249 RepID=UPI001C11BC5E|nr:MULTISPECIES: hypothetical protein [Paenibacillus]MBU5353844.1 hypothetical protein [Paenibacillus barcinonensis]
MEEIKVYIPLIATLFTIFSGYIATIRYKKSDRFYSSLTENMKEIGSPFYLSLRSIVKEKNIYKRNKLIAGFFEENSSSKSKVYLLNNNYIIEWYFLLDERYGQYISNPNDENWEEFWVRLYQLYIMMEEEYWKNFNTLNREFRWLRYVWSTNNYLYRTFKELIRILTDTLNFLSSCILLFFAFALWMKFFGEPIVIPDEYTDLVISIITLVLMLWGLMIAIGSIYTSQINLTLKEKRCYKLLKIMLPQKIANKIIDKFKRWEDRGLKNKIEIPDRY